MSAIIYFFIGLTVGAVLTMILTIAGIGKDYEDYYDGYEEDTDL